MIRHLNKRIKILSKMSLSEAILLLARRIINSTGSNGIPYDEFVFADTVGYILDIGGDCVREGLENRIFFVHEPSGKKLSFSLRRKTTDFHIFNQVFRSCEYQSLIDLAHKLDLPENPVIVDAGANVGCTSIWFQCAFPNALVFAVEIEKGNFEKLERNIHINSMDKNVKPLNFALWSRCENLVIHDQFRDGREYAFSVKLPENREYHSDLVVKGISMREIRDRFNIEQVHILKMDIEGSEKFLLEDLATATDTLDTVRLLALEVHDEMASRTLIEANLKQLGFSWITQHETLFAFR